MPTAAYIHIPFCRRRCFYCDFAISVVGDTKHGGNSGTIAQYLPHLLAEIRTAIPRSPLKTIFFGGGTPSLLTPEQLGTIIQTLIDHLGLAPEAELSMEIDPGTFDLAKLQGFQQAGINRFSFGIQAFQAELLANCGRSHTLEDIDRALTHITAAGVQNFSLDLISGLPTQTLEDWSYGLDRAIAINPPHLSIYDLTIEPGTPFGKQLRPGDRPLPDDDTTAAMYRMAHDRLTAAGYNHYEISNYAKPGFQCRHNRVYWENQPFYGFGMGATSFVGGDRIARPRTLQTYYDWQPEPLCETPPQILDVLMTGLRLREGLALGSLVETFGQILVERVVKAVGRYMPQWVEPIEGPSDDLRSVLDHRLRLTCPEGFLFSNVVLIKLFEALDDETESSSSTHRKV
jgi:putative oxygen-independent coproporphyrinogen III oxidase